MLTMKGYLIVIIIMNVIGAVMGFIHFSVDSASINISEVYESAALVLPIFTASFATIVLRQCMKNKDESEK